MRLSPPVWRRCAELHDPGPPFTLLFARPPDGSRQPVYGWERDSHFEPFGSVDGFVPGRDALVHLSIFDRVFGPREGFLDFDARTLRVVAVP